MDAVVARPVVLMSDVVAIAEIRAHLQREFGGFPIACLMCSLPMPPVDQPFEVLEPLEDPGEFVLPKGQYRRSCLQPGGTSHYAWLKSPDESSTKYLNLGYLDWSTMDWRAIRAVK